MVTFACEASYCSRLSSYLIPIPFDRIYVSVDLFCFYKKSNKEEKEIKDRKIR